MRTVVTGDCKCSKSAGKYNSFPATSQQTASKVRDSGKLMFPSHCSMASRKFHIVIAACAFLAGIWIIILHTTKTTLLPKCVDETNLGKLPRRVNVLVTDYDAKLNMSLHRLIEAGAGPRDPRVLDLIRSLLDPPSNHMIKLARRARGTPQSSEILKILGNRVCTWITLK